MTTIRGARATLAGQALHRPNRPSRKNSKKNKSMNVEAAGHQTHFRLATSTVESARRHAATERSARDREHSIAARRAAVLRATIPPRSSGTDGNACDRAGRREKEARYLRLWRSRFRSLRFLCLRIFFRRHLTTLPTGYSQSRRRGMGTGSSRRKSTRGRCAATGFGGQLGSARDRSRAPAMPRARPSERLTRWRRGRNGSTGRRRTPEAAPLLQQRRRRRGSTIRPRFR